jgi:Tol biopolymer transport system component
MDSARRQKIEDVCHSALERPPADWPAIVAAACGGDAALQADVEALLRHARQAGTFLEQPLGEVAATIIGSDSHGLVPGRRFGPYEILALIGAGGMGEVYRARDTQLGRDVAIKVIASAAPRNADRLARFDREARVLAALNHPNIGAIYGLEEAEGTRALVLELVEGKTLAERLAATRMSVPAALSIASDIAAALEAAHDKGVMHLDLKPANITIASDGAVKVLDFGLAKVFARDEVADDASRVRDITTDDGDGVIAGTAGYMSPEQARGATVTKRSDIWGFGCVLYEMLAGRPAFGGETRADIMASILERDPDWSALPAATPLTVRRLLRRALERDPARRLRDIGDARLEIDEALSAPASPELGERADSSGGAAVKPSARLRAVRWMTATAVLAGATALALWFSQRYELFWRDPLAGATYTPLTGFIGAAAHHAAISRNGQFVVFVSDHETRGTWDAWVRLLGAGVEFHNLTRGRIEELRNPATRTVGFNWDGSLVVLWRRTGGNAQGGLVDAGWVVPPLGGEIRPYLKGTESISELDWSSDGTRIVYHPPKEGDPLFVTAPNEKTGTQIFVAAKGMHNHYPIWSRDDKLIYFVHGLPLENSDIWSIPSSGGTPKRVTSHNSSVSFPTLIDDRTLLYLATDEDGYGPWIYATDVNRGVAHRISRGLEQYTSLSASADGRKLVATVSQSTSSLWRIPLSDRPVEASEASQLALPTANGSLPRVGAGVLTYRAPRAGLDGIWKIEPRVAPTALWNGVDGRAMSGAVVSPDGRHAAFVVLRRGIRHLYVVSMDGSGARRVSRDVEVRGAPAWSPDSRWVAVGTIHGNKVNLMRFPIDGGPPVPLVEDGTDPVWSPSGAFLVYTGEDVGTNFDLRAINADGTRRAMPSLIRLTRGARRMAFLREDALVIMKGDVSNREFYRVDLRTGAEMKLSNLGRAFVIHDFDISANGREIIFERIQEESNIMLIERPVR